MSRGMAIVVGASVGGILLVAGIVVGGMAVYAWLSTTEPVPVNPSGGASGVVDEVESSGDSDSYATSKTDEDESDGARGRDTSRAALRPGQSISIARDVNGGAHLLAIMYDGNSVVLPSQAGEYVEVVDLFTREVVDTSMKHESAVACLDATDDGSRYISIGDDGSADVYHRLDDGTYEHVVKDDRFCDFPVDLDIDPMGEFASVVCSDLSVRVVDLSTGDDWSFRGTRGGFECATFSPDSLWLLAGSTRGDVYVWDLETGERHLRLEIPDLDDAIVQVGWLPETLGFYAVTGFGRLLVWPEYPEPDKDGESDVAPEFDWAIADVPIHLIETVRGGGGFVMSRDALTVEYWNVSALVQTARERLENRQPAVDPAFSARASGIGQITAIDVDDSGTIVGMAFTNGSVRLVSIEQGSTSRRRGG